MRWLAITCLAAALSAGPASAQLGRTLGQAGTGGHAGSTASQGDPSEQPSGAADPVMSRIERAWQNYLAVSAGRRDLAHLTPEEVVDLIELDRRVRAQPTDHRSARERCIDQELDSLGRAPSRLALRSIDLKCSQR